MSKLLEKYLSSDGKRALLTRRDRSIQRSVDLLRTLEESNNGEDSSLSTLERGRWRLPSASSSMKVEEIQQRIIHSLPPPVYFSSSEEPGTLSPLQYLEEAMSPDESMTQRPTSDQQLGSRTHTDGPSGPPTTGDSAEDSEKGYLEGRHDDGDADDGAIS